MYSRLERGRTLTARHLFLLVALAFAATLSFFSNIVVSPAAAQSETPADKIAFTRDSQIVVANPDGTGAVILGPGSDPSWSKLGKIAFTFAPNVETTQIAVMNEDGTNQVNLTLAATGNRNAAFSPDGTKIAYVTETVEPGDPPFDGSRARIYIMDADGQNRRRFFSGNLISGMRQETDPAWSPDGTKIAFIGQTVVDGLSSHDVYVANADGLSAPVNVTNLGGSRIFSDQIAWSPDGLKLAFRTGRDIHVVNADGSGGLINLTNTVNSDESDPAWSPDGKKIAYSLNHFTDNTLDGIYVMDADGQNQTFLNTKGYQPTWKPRDVEPEPEPTPTPTPESDVAVQLTALPNPVAVGQNLTYTLTVKNNGPSAAENVQAVFLRPASTEFVSASAAQGSCAPDSADPQKTVCQLGQIGSNAQTSIQVVVRPTVSGEVVAFSSASSPTADTNPNNNGQQLALTVKEACVEEVTSLVQQSIARPGSQDRRNLKHTIIVRNNSGRRLNGLVHFVFDGLPASVEDGDPRSSFFLTRCAEPLGRKYTSVGVRDLVWEPGQVIELKVDFFNPDRVPVNYNLRIYTGPGFP
ncbi:MAG TPA: hypothetical protein VF553_14470 [Pyrinomonadaceae bacterium]|jgi:uncharacterized repeat protein (TIGR01451 family)